MRRKRRRAAAAAPPAAEPAPAEGPPPAKRARATPPAAEQPSADAAGAAAGPATFFVGNLPRTQDAEAQLRAVLRKQCGAKLSRFRALRDERGLPSGCALVGFCRARQATSAVSAAEGALLWVSGRQLRIEPQRTRKELAEQAPVDLAGSRAACFVANAPLNLYDWQLREVMARFGDVRGVVLNTDADGGFNARRGCSTPRLRRRRRR